MELLIDTTVLDEIGDKLQRISKKTMTAIGQTIKSDIQINYKSEKEPDGSSWADLKQSTIKAKQKAGKEKKLVNTRNLYNSLNFKAGTGIVEVGYGIKYSVFHQLGTKNMAARKILPTEVSEIDMEEIESLILREITNV